MKSDKTISVVGRRKESTARVRLTPGNGQVTVNGKPIFEYFRGPILQKIYSRPFEITNAVGKNMITAVVSGGGQISQLGAVIHGIARVIAKTNPALRTILKKEGYLTRDARVKERRKFGNAQKARAKKQSPKR